MESLSLNCKEEMKLGNGLVESVVGVGKEMLKFDPNYAGGGEGDGDQEMDVEGGDGDDEDELDEDDFEDELSFHFFLPFWIPSLSGSVARRN